MYDLTQKEVGVNGDGMFRYRFSFVPNGTAAPTLVGGKYVKSVTRSATGLFLVTFSAAFNAVLGFKFGVRETSGGPLATLTSVQLDPANTTMAPAVPSANGSVVAFRLCNNAGASTDFTSTTTGAQVDIECVFATDPSNLS